MKSPTTKEDLKLIGSSRLTLFDINNVGPPFPCNILFLVRDEVDLLEAFPPQTTNQQIYESQVLSHEI